ncbi:hypothetical protein V6N13_025051 [Hibiscus sabdariffa]
MYRASRRGRGRGGQSADGWAGPQATDLFEPKANLAETRACRVPLGLVDERTEDRDCILFENKVDLAGTRPCQVPHGLATE